MIYTVDMTNPCLCIDTSTNCVFSNISVVNGINGDKSDLDAESSKVEPRNEDCTGLYIMTIEMANSNNCNLCTVISQLSVIKQPRGCRIMQNDG